MRKKKIRRRLPCGLHKLGALGHWLDDCAIEGLRLERLNGLWAVFRKDMPQRSRCRFYPGRPDETQKGLFLEMGWHYVTMLQTDLAVFRCDDPAAPELCTDPVIEAETYRHCDKKFLQSLICMIAEPILSILLYVAINRMFYGGIMNGALRNDHIRLSLVHLFAGGFEVVAALLLFFAATWSGAVCRFRSIHALRRRLARGEPIDYAAPYAKRRGLSLREWEGLATVLLFAVLVWINCIDKQPFAQAAAPVPAPLLADLEGREIQYATSGSLASRVERKTTILAELFCEGWQYDAEMTVFLDSIYIRARFPQTAGAAFGVLAEGCASGTDTALFGEAETIPAADGRFDSLTCVSRRRGWEDGTESERLWTVAARRGRQVVSVRYSGPQPLSRLLDELDAMMQRFEEGEP